MIYKSAKLQHGDHAIGATCHATCRRILECLALAGWSGCAWPILQPIGAQAKEGTLVINYYASAPDPELEQLRTLTVDALGVYLRGQILLTDSDLGWAESVRSTSRSMDRIVSDMLRIRSFAGTEKFDGFSPLVSDLLLDFEELDPRDAERFRTGQSRSFEENLYVLVEQRIRKSSFKQGGSSDAVNRAAQENWHHRAKRARGQPRGMDGTRKQELQPLELNFSLETMSLMTAPKMEAGTTEHASSPLPQASSK